ncbi:MAG: fatty acid desaturase [Planctomycetota bacterium]|jgi:stearoyl-CoA desaturase (delta-9 desaturase)|nr:fatty acid desaturase [Planctomycetota bacterium]
MNRKRLHWTNFLFVSAAHLVAVFAIVYLVVFHFSWWTIGFGALWGIFCGLSITGGYHRLFSHSAYVASWPLRVFYLAFGAASVQNSALVWAADHRTHHAHTDHDRDPYSIERGFWWAHIGWVVCKSNEHPNRSLVRDLEADPLVRFQHRFYLPLALLFSSVAPAAIGTAWGDPIGALLVAGWLRLVIQWHATFSVNSFAHLIGSQPYERTGTARDSLIVALLTMGEGYHNFHHRFQIDYRNGVRWYHFDPTKWWVWASSCLGLTRKLRRVPAERIEAVRRAVRLQSSALT